MAFWEQLTAPQATVISTILTVLSTIFGVSLGLLFFNNRINSLKSAINKTEELVNKYIDNINLKFKQYREENNEASAALSAQVGQIGGAVADIAAADGNGLISSLGEGRRSIKENWVIVRDKIENIASDPEIDGRTRAKYARIDRRRYGDLIAALSADGRLQKKDQSFRSAYEIWLKFRSGRLSPSEIELSEMQDIVNNIEKIQ